MDTFFYNLQLTGKFDLYQALCFLYDKNTTFVKVDWGNGEDNIVVDTSLTLIYSEQGVNSCRCHDES